MKITVRVRAGAREDHFALEGASYVAKVRAFPRDNAANEALIALVAGYFKVPRSVVRVARGAHGRVKIIEINA